MIAHLFISRFGCEETESLFDLCPTGWSQDNGVLGQDELGSDSLCPPTCTCDIVLLQNLVVSAGTHSASWDGKAEGSAAPIIHTACVVTWKNRSQIRTLAHLKQFFSKFHLKWVVVFCQFFLCTLNSNPEKINHLNDTELIPCFRETRQVYAMWSITIRQVNYWKHCG